MQSQRRPGRVPSEQKASSRRDLDLNRERLVFVLTSLVGQRVTAQLRNNVTYEGLFHSCSLDGDFTITLKSARQLPTADCKSGEVISTLLILGKDFLQVSAADVPPPSLPDTKGSTVSGAFSLDQDIARKKGLANHERELVPWTGGEAADGLDTGDGLDDEAHEPGHWDQFGINAQMYGVTSTYREEIYTTPLDPMAISKEKREEADRIAREIESGVMATEVEGRVEGQDHDGDEEATFSAAQGISAFHRKVPLTKEHLTQHDKGTLVGNPGDGCFAREHRTKRGMITAHSPMRSSPMVQEMKRINALNLEPALPKLDDKTRNDWINFKQSQSRQNSRAMQGSGLKMEFQQSLEMFKNRDANRQREQASGSVDAGSDQGRRQHNQAAAQGSAAVETPGSESGRNKNFQFNIRAKEFNPNAAPFVPGGGSGGGGGGGSGSGGGGGGAAPGPAAKATGSQPTFRTQSVNADLLKKPLDDLLNSFFDRFRGESSEQIMPVWEEATGPSFHQVLGQPNPANPLPPPGAMIPGGTMPGAWQHQVGGAGPGPQMYAQMYTASGGMPVQRPPNGGPPQGQPQQGMVFNQQGMMGQQPGGSMGMAGGMVGNMQGGQNPGGVAMGSVPKFGAQVVPMVGASGQYNQQGYMQQQAVQGQSGPGPPLGGPQGTGQMMQGNQMMQSGWGPPDGRRHGGMSHQMSGHES